MMRRIRTEDIPQLHDMSVAHSCPDTSLEFWQLMVSDFSEHCFVVEHTAGVRIIVGFIAATDTSIVQLAIGWKHKKFRYWLLRRCLESFDRGTVLLFRVSELDVDSMSHDLAKLDFVHACGEKDDRFVLFSYMRPPLRFVCGTCES